jgi:SPP1 gp7 family putative phage head morphogenesis protein
MKNPIKTRTTERWYETQLRKVARHVGDIIRGIAEGFEPGAPGVAPVVDRAMSDYSTLLDSWARIQGSKMIQQVARSDEEAWMQRAREMASWLKRELRTTPTGPIMDALLAEQVGLIKSIPLAAAQRVHKIVQDAQISGVRADTVAAEIMRTNEVSASKARLIARTEVARASSKLTEARARRIGSKGYIWRTSTDADVRHSHKEMEGKYVDWDNPPTLSDGHTTHAGQIFNCRCWCEPVIPDL